MAGGPADPPHRHRVQRAANVSPQSEAGAVQSPIIDHVWHYDFNGNQNIVETYVRYLRKKLDAVGPPLIHTIRLVGYVLREG